MAQFGFGFNPTPFQAAQPQPQQERRVNYNPNVRSLSGNPYGALKPGEGPGAASYARTAPSPAYVYGQPVQQIQSQFWSSTQDKMAAIEEANRQGGVRAYQNSPSYQPLQYNQAQNNLTSQSYTGGLSAFEMAQQYNAQLAQQQAAQQQQNWFGGSGSGGGGSANNGGGGGGFGFGLFGGSKGKSKSSARSRRRHSNRRRSVTKARRSKRKSNSRRRKD